MAKSFDAALPFRWEISCMELLFAIQDRALVTPAIASISARNIQRSRRYCPREAYSICLGKYWDGFEVCRIEGGQMSLAQQRLFIEKPRQQPNTHRPHKRPRQLIES